MTPAPCPPGQERFVKKIGFQRNPIKRWKLLFL